VAVARRKAQCCPTTVNRRFDTLGSVLSNAAQQHMNTIVIEQKSHSVAEAARILGVHSVSVYRLIWEGKIKTLRGFKRLKIPASELEKFLADVR
jgi:excisionase family DNA binding protein